MEYTTATQQMHERILKAYKANTNAWKTVTMFPSYTLQLRRDNLAVRYSDYTRDEELVTVYFLTGLVWRPLLPMPYDIHKEWVNLLCTKATEPSYLPTAEQVKPVTELLDKWYDEKLASYRITIPMIDEAVPTINTPKYKPCCDNQKIEKGRHESVHFGGEVFIDVYACFCATCGEVFSLNAWEYLKEGEKQC